MPKGPLISVIMPAYNAEKYISRAVESILNQTFPDFELIIINDMSTDATKRILESFAQNDPRIRLINNTEKLTVAASLNKAVHLALAPIIARMDADDESLPHRLEKQYNLITSNENISIVGADMIIVNEDGKPISKRGYPETSRELKKMMLRYSPFAHPVVMFRKDPFLEFGGYDVNIPRVEDIDLWFKMGTKYDFASIAEPLLNYTLLMSSNSHKNVKRQEIEGFPIKLRAILKYGYKPTLHDIAYNILQYLTFWIMPSSFRVKLYNALRSRNLI